MLCTALGAVLIERYAKVFSDFLADQRGEVLLFVATLGRCDYCPTALDKQAAKRVGNERSDSVGKLTTIASSAFMSVRVRP